MNARTLLALAAACSLSTAALAQQPGERAADADQSTATTSTAGGSVAPDAAPKQRVDPRVRTLRKMMRPVTVEFDNVRLEEALAFFQELTGAEFDVFYLNDRTTSGLDPDREVSLSVENTLAIDALERLLEEASDDEFDEATWQLSRDGYLEVSTRSRLNRRAYVRTYYVDDLLFVIPDNADAPELDIDSVLGGQGGGGGQSPFTDDDDENDEEFLEGYEETLEQLTDLIREAIEPEQWRANGGEGGSIRIFRRTMVVRAPDYMHRQLDGYDWLPRGYAAFRQTFADRLRREDGGVQRYGPGAE
jgi:hypothetical protein